MRFSLRSAFMRCSLSAAIRAGGWRGCGFPAQRPYASVTVANVGDGGLLRHLVRFMLSTSLSLYTRIPAFIAFVLPCVLSGIL